MNNYKLCFDTGFYFMQEVSILIENDTDIEKMIMLGIKEVIRNDFNIDFYNVKNLSVEEYQELEENERYMYFDFTMDDLEVYFINLENFRYIKIKKNEEV